MSTRLLCPECHGDRFIVDDDNEEFNCDCCDARGWIVGEPDAEVTALRARVRELEGARTTAIREAVERLSDEVIARELSSPGDWWFDDAASFRAALLAALLPAPAPGRDTTTSRALAAGGNDGE